MALVIKGSSSGQVTLDVPAAAGTNTITIPATSGTMLDTNSVIDKSKLPSGAIVQMIHNSTSTTTSTSGTTYVASNIAAQITPRVAANKIIVIACGSVYISGGNQQSSTTIYRDSTNLGHADRGIIQFWDIGGQFQGNASIMLTDHPNTTNAVTYAMYFRKLSSGGDAVHIGVDASTQYITLLEVQV